MSTEHFQKNMTYREVRLRVVAVVDIFDALSMLILGERGTLKWRWVGRQSLNLMFKELSFWTRVDKAYNGYPPKSWRALAWDLFDGRGKW